MNTRTFRDLAHEGWSARAATYADAAGRVTAQAIGPILDTFGDLFGKRLLDIACGPGELAGEAAQRGAVVTGVDFAAPMLERAAAAFPQVDFKEAEAEQLPFGDAGFDAVTCAFAPASLR